MKEVLGMGERWFDVAEPLRAAEESWWWLQQWLEETSAGRRASPGAGGRGEGTREKVLVPALWVTAILQRKSSSSWLLAFHLMAILGAGACGGRRTLL